MRLIGVGAELGVFGGSPAVDGLITFDPWAYGVDGASNVLPPHLVHLGLSPADPGVSEDVLLRRPLRFG